jgi:hypothetical protein
LSGPFFLSSFRFSKAARGARRKVREIGIGVKKTTHLIESGGQTAVREIRHYEFPALDCCLRKKSFTVRCRAGAEHRREAFMWQLISSSVLGADLTLFGLTSRLYLWQTLHAD